MLAIISRAEICRIQDEIEDCGFGSLATPLYDQAFEDLKLECTRQWATSRRVVSDESPAYRGYLSDLGPRAKNLLDHHATREFLHTLFGKNFSYNPGSSCYTYYGPGDYLDVHLDGSGDCEVTALLYLWADCGPQADDPDQAPRLQLYSESNGAAGRRMRSLPTRSGSMLVGFGSKVWHARPPLSEGQRVALLTACFV